MKVVIDTDILSMFAKVDGIGILIDFLGSGRIVMTPSIRDEISIPLQYGVYVSKFGPLSNPCYTFEQASLGRT
ncbi:MAG: hypothetical protein COZ69_13760 [Deltaproteobacteria bacterium CG_4_8_14_3_um_filter_45_9]|nr:MAG: hypothetical protein COZ69_13760 [Deltaproteobacteria bacterium CG_4_8_14_3_um_filter_45_9]